MKLFLKLLLLFTFLVYCNQSKANDDYYKTLDSAEYVVSYVLTFKIDTLDLDKIYSEEMLLFVGKEKSLFISHNNYRSTSMNDDYNHNINLKGKTIVLDERGGNILSSKFYFRIYKNLPQGKLTYIDFIPIYFYKYEEPLNNMEWEIKEDRMRIMGYSVQKAVTNYGGRTWEAWFTPDIPINDGPYKFSGLPGLILKVNDVENHYEFFINKFGKQNNPIPILWGEEKYINMTRKDYHDFEKTFTGDLYQQLLQMGITVDDPEPLKRGSKTHNNFLERNYNN